MTILLGVILLMTVPALPAQQRLVSTVAQVYGDEDSENSAVFSTPVGLPPNVTMAIGYDDLVDAMLRSSPTFRAQCSRIARASHLHVTIRRSVFAAPQSAVTHMTRHDDGRIDADVEVGLFGDVVLLIAHEFEHILEQLDGVNLAAMATR